jgi:hypothetical protein
MTESKINRFIKTSTGAIHQTTEASSAQMQDNKDLKVQVIVELINKQNKIETISPNYKLNIKNKIRLIESKKTRYNLIHYYYTITDTSDKSIIISSADSSVKTVARLQIIHIEASTKIKEV